MKLKEYNDKIDVIIPAYNVPDKILSRCLASIAMQECIDDVEVTIVDDASTEENYEKVAEKFSGIMKTNVLHMEVNGGPGVARQYGLDHTNNGLITFVDADDTLANAFALSIMKLVISNGDAAIAICNFDEVRENEGDIFFMPHEDDDVWVFGKMYRRDFIDENKIRFHPTSRANEDNGFNKICKFCSMKSNRGISVGYRTVYYWHFTNESITRSNNFQYEFGISTRDSFYGFVENMIYACKYAKEHDILFFSHEETTDEFILRTMCYCFIHYTKAKDLHPKNAEKTLEHCKMFYDEIFKSVENSFDEEQIKKTIHNVFKNEYVKNGMIGVEPSITFNQFLVKLKGEVQ